MPYSVLMLFDRSGSMASNDPSDDTLVAAREFVARMAPVDQGWVAAFPSTPFQATSPVTFYGDTFITDQGLLTTQIDSFGPVDGNTPLWDSAFISLEKFPALPAASENRALLAFSDSKDAVLQPPPSWGCYWASHCARRARICDQSSQRGL